MVDHRLLLDWRCGFCSDLPNGGTSAVYEIEGVDVQVVVSHCPDHVEEVLAVLEKVSAALGGLGEEQPRGDHNGR